MDIEIEVWLNDILNAIREIDSFFAGKPRIFDEFSKDLRTKRAVERELEIIGEAVNRIRKKNPQFQLENSSKIIGTRNLIIHGYDSVSDEMLWSILIRHLPALLKEVQELLDKG